MTQKICVRCLKFFEYCECAAGPRETRHPTECKCAMCELGRRLFALSSTEPSGAVGAVTGRSSGKQPSNGNLPKESKS